MDKAQREVKSFTQKTNILIVDDDNELRKTLSEILKKEGWYVSTAENGKQALKASMQVHFNIALIDIRLPDMTGIEILRKLRRTEPNMVKILITGYPTLETAVEAVNKEADGYILKPFNPEKLLALIKEHLKKQRENAAYSEQKVTEFIESRVRELEKERLKIQNNSKDC